MKTGKYAPLGLAVGMLCGTLILCGTASDAQKKGPKKTASDAAVVAAGKEIYAANHCAACHVIGTEGGKSGPALTHVGADPKHTSKWLTDEITNPKSHKPEGKMPAYPQIQGKDLKALVAYLGSLKK